jgi:hypothetical protein
VRVRTPRFERLKNGQDPVAYIMSANVERRHLNRGQIALAWALAYPEPAKRGGSKDRGSMLRGEGLTSGSLAKARAVLSKGALIEQETFRRRKVVRGRTFGPPWHRFAAAP